MNVYVLLLPIILQVCKIKSYERVDEFETRSHKKQNKKVLNLKYIIIIHDQQR